MYVFLYVYTVYTIICVRGKTIHSRWSSIDRDELYMLPKIPISDPRHAFDIFLRHKLLTTKSYPRQNQYKCEGMSILYLRMINSEYRSYQLKRHIYIIPSPISFAK